MKSIHTTNMPNLLSDLLVKWKKSILRHESLNLFVKIIKLKMCQ